MDSEMTFEEFVKKLKATPKDKVVLLPTSMLTPAEYNPRITNDERYQALKKSMKEDPDFTKLRPVLVNVHEGREGIVFAGARRLLAAQENELPRIPAMVVDVPLTQEKAWNLKDNTHAGDWDEEKKKEVIIDLHDGGFDMSTIGFGSTEIVDVLDVKSSTAVVPADQDPENQGGTPRRTPKVKIAEGAELECPNCHTTFTYGLKVETTGEDY